MGREIRRVPEKWKHPRRIINNKMGYIPLNDDYEGSLEYYKNDVDSFVKQMKDIIKYGKLKIYDRTFTKPESAYEYLTEDSLIPPDINDYMPKGSWYQLYENVSEGTPLTPPFKTKKELVEWMSENEDYWGNKWTKEGAKSMVSSEYAPSGIFANNKYYWPEEQYKLKGETK